jgi:hypothetical protein
VEEVSRDEGVIVNDADRATFPVYAPVTDAAVEQIPEPGLLGDLSGKTIMELWDWRFNGDLMFKTLREEIRARYEDVTFIGYEVFGNSHGPDEVQKCAELPALLQKYNCDAVISAVGN